MKLEDAGVGVRMDCNGNPDIVVTDGGSLVGSTIAYDAIGMVVVTGRFMWTGMMTSSGGSGAVCLVGVMANSISDIDVLVSFGSVWIEVGCILSVSGGSSFDEWLVTVVFNPPCCMVVVGFCLGLGVSTVSLIVLFVDSNMPRRLFSSAIVCWS